jgi:hypothetical protein
VFQRALALFAVVACLVVAPARPSFAQDDDDAALKPAEPDFTLVSLPTSLRLPEHKMAFRVTHRFTRPLKCDQCGSSLLGDGLGLDEGAQIGLELRFAPIRRLQVGVDRVSDKTVDFFAEYGLLRQGRQSPLEVAIRGSIDGSGNFSGDSHSPSLGAIVSRQFGDWIALYVEPTWVNNTNPLPKAVVDHNDTFFVGVGGRLRVMRTVYVVAEVAPRASGYRPGANHASFGIEKRAGGHMFQVNFSDSFGTAPVQIARGGATSSDWYLGFNISRKFF